MIRLSEGREFRYSVITRNKARGSFLNEADDRGEDSVSINAVRSAIQVVLRRFPQAVRCRFLTSPTLRACPPISTARISRLLMPGGPGGFGTQFFH